MVGPPIPKIHVNKQTSQYTSTNIFRHTMRSVPLSYCLALSDRNCPNYVLYISVESFLELISRSNAIHFRKSEPAYVPVPFAMPCFLFCFTCFQSSTTSLFCHAQAKKSRMILKTCQSFVYAIEIRKSSANPEQFLVFSKPPSLTLPFPAPSSLKLEKFCTPAIFFIYPPT